MAGLKWSFIPDLLDEHFEELQFLWGWRQTMLRSPRNTLRELADLEERIGAHAQALLVPGEQVLPLVGEALRGDEPLAAFAAAYTLLRLPGEAPSQRVLDAFLEAQPGQLDGLREALCHGPITATRGPLQQALTSAPAAIAVAAAEILAFHGLLQPTREQLDRFVTDEAPAVRQAGWRTVARLKFARPPDLYQIGLRDAEAAVRREALAAAAWGRQPWLLEHCRKQAARPAPDSWDAIYLLAVLGQPQDLPRILAAGRATALGPPRLQVLGAFGHPGVVDLLLTEMGNKDPRVAVAAGAAFTKLTGTDVESDQRVALPPADGHEPDDFEKEFLEEVKLPDPERARAHWQKGKDAFSKGTRWCRGLDVSPGPTAEMLAQLDMESRGEVCLRGKFQGTWQGSRTDLEVFPQKQAGAVS